MVIIVIVDGVGTSFRKLTRDHRRPISRTKSRVLALDDLSRSEWRSMRGKRVE